MENKINLFWRSHKVAASVIVVLLAVCITFTTAFAASSTFRKAVISIFFPLYLENEIIEVDNGHMTSSFDEIEVLNTFLEKFNGENMEEGLKAKKEYGFESTLVYEGEDSIKAIVTTDNPDYMLLVMMERVPYKETTNLSQVVAYQIVDAKTANAMIIDK